MRAVVAASMLIVSPMATSAGEMTYSAEQMVEYFAGSADLGAERGICIGTAQECSATQAPAAAVTVELLVTFELNSDELSEQAKASLREFAKALNDPRLADARFSVEGHTDATGPEIYNLDLSGRRADAVVTFLREQGADTARFVVKAFGASHPRSNDPFDPTNRRVETRILQ